MAAPERLLEKLGRLALALDDDRVRNDGSLRREALQSSAKRRDCGSSKQAAAVEIQQIEPERRERQFGAHAISTSSLRPKRRIVIWKGCGRQSCAQAQHLAIENQIPGRE